MRETTLKELKKGDFFTLKNYGEETTPDSRVYVKGDYIRETKKYEVYKFTDVNSFTEKSGKIKVFTDFTF